MIKMDMANKTFNMTKKLDSHYMETEKNGLKNIVKVTKNRSRPIIWELIITTLQRAH